LIFGSFFEIEIKEFGEKIKKLNDRKIFKISTRKCFGFILMRNGREKTV